MSLFGGGHKSAAATPTRAMGVDLQGAQYGSPVPVVFGKNKLAGNVIWYGDFKATAHTQKQGGKGGGGGQKSTSYTYSSSYLLGLCEGVASITTVYDGSSATTLSKVGGLAFTGEQGQAAWSHLSGNAALGYSGTALAAFQNKDLGSSASLPNYNFEIAGRNQYGSGVVDANPADIVTAVCTDNQIGVQFDALGDLTAFGTYCAAAGIFFSPIYSTQNPAQQTLDDLFKYSNAAAFFSEGVLKVVPYSDATITGNGTTYTPELTAVADLGPDDFITNGSGDPVTIKRIAPADAMNIRRIEFSDRANTYHTSTVVASIDQDVVGTGSRADQSDSVDMITEAAVARMVVQNLLQRDYYIRNTYQFQLSWRYCYLEPMDIVTLTDANTGLYLSPVRITEVDEDEHGLLSITAEEFPEGVSHGGTYATQPNGGATVDPNADPGPVDGPYLFRGPGFLVSNNQPEIWCALTGNSPFWAGCDVYISQDGDSYNYLASTTRRAAYGELTNTLAAGDDPDTTGAPNVVLNGPAQLLGGSQADADGFVTLAMVDNEIISYETATLADGPSYTLGYLRRGGYGSDIADHAVAAPFVRLDENILRIPVDPSQIGQTVWMKFVSFNVFGKGGRTLDEETAYEYVIGTNIELPDVPLTPTNIVALGVADGISITWTNPNPAAVGCTSIERATASSGPWTVVAQDGPTSTSFTDHFTTRTTYFYRLRARGPVVAGGWSDYSDVYTATGNPLSAVQQRAQNAQPAFIINPNFADQLEHWEEDTPPGGWYEEAGANSPNPQITTYAVHAGSTVTAANPDGVETTALRNLGFVPTSPGESFVVTAQILATDDATGSANARISWRNQAQTEISLSMGNFIDSDGTLHSGTSTASGIAPAGAVYAHAEVATYTHTAGYFTFTGLKGSFQEVVNVIDDANTARTLVPSDTGQVIRGTNAAGLTITIPTVAEANWLNGTTIYALQGAAGQVQFVGASGVTFAPSDSQATRAQGSMIAVKMIADDVWEAVGDLAYTLPACSVPANVTGASAQPSPLVVSADGDVIVRRGGLLVSGALAASEVTNTPAGGIAATTAQDALNELDTKKATIPGAETFAVAGGTSDALTAAFTPAITAPVDGMQIKVRALAANATTTPTLAVDALDALTITKFGGQPLAAGDIYGAGHELIFRYVSATPALELTNPAASGSGGVQTVTGSAVDNTDPQNPVINSTGGGGNDLSKAKAADESRSSTTTLADDTELTGIALTAGSIYRVRLFAVATAASTTPKIKFSLAYSGTATAIGVINLASPGSTAYFVGQTNNGSLPLTSNPGSWASGSSGVFIWDVTLTATTSGTLSFQWAQQTSGASVITVLAGSRLECQLIG